MQFWAIFDMGIIYSPANSDSKSTMKQKPPFSMDKLKASIQTIKTSPDQNRSLPEDAKSTKCKITKTNHYDNFNIIGQNKPYKFNNKPERFSQLWKLEIQQKKKHTPWKLLVANVQIWVLLHIELKHKS